MHAQDAEATHPLEMTDRNNDDCCTGEATSITKFNRWNELQNEKASVKTLGRSGGTG